MDTLVLSRDYQPLAQVTWQDAFTYLLSGKAEVVEEYEDRVVHSAYQTWKIPSIIRFLTKAANLFRRGVKFNRQNVWVRDHGECQYCGDKVRRSEFTYDHVIPRAQGGKTVWENIVVCCIPCNQKKRSRAPEQAGMRLRHAPYRPKVLPGVSSEILSWHDGMPRSWKEWIGSVSYWHGEWEA